MKRGKAVRFWLKILAPMLASIAGLAALRLLGPDILNQQTLRAFLQPLGVFAPLVFIGLLAIRPVTLLPGQMFTAVGGILFGVVLGSVYALLGSVLATALVFFASRRFGTKMMRRFAGKSFAALRATAKKHDFKVVALVTINPLFPTDVMVALAGASGARFWPTALGLVLGTAPGTVLTAQFGSALSQGKTLMTIVAAAGMILSMVLGAFLGRRIVGDFRTEKDDQARRENEGGKGGRGNLAEAT